MRTRTAPGIAEETIRALLEADRAWSAYALADLFPPWNEHSEWWIEGDSAILVYRGLKPPVLFAIGSPAYLDGLFLQLPAGEYWATLRPTEFSRLRKRMVSFSRARMWRMRLVHDQVSVPSPAFEVHPLTSEDVGRIEELFAPHSDRPDAFAPEQVSNGIYYGLSSGEELASIAGTHVLNHELRIAAVGNVFTAPQHRGKGFARAVSTAVLDRLLQAEMETVVLNVEMSNAAAIDLYRSLGFMPYCGFYEGILVLN